jgi:iron complex outermembrane recepter protein
MSHTRNVIAVAGLLIAGSAAAQEKEEDSTDQQEPDVEKLPETVILGKAQLSPWVQETELDVIQPGSAADAAELLRCLPGVSGARMGGRGIDPIIRGQGQSRLNVLLDGAYVHGGCPNRMDPPTSYSPINSYEEVTVIRGAQTVRYGGGGSGGSLLFRRRTPRFQEWERLRGQVTGGITSNAMTRDLALDAAAGMPLGFLRGLAHYKEADNYEDGDGREVRSAYESRGGALIGGWTPADDQRLEVSYESTRDRDVLYSGAGMDGPLSDNDTWRLRYEQGTLPGVFSDLNFELYTSAVSHQMDNYSLRTQTAPRKMLVDSDSDTHGGRLSGDIDTSLGIWTLGFDYQENERDATRFWDLGAPDPSVIQSFMWPGAELAQSGVFSELAVPVGDERRIIAGARLDRVSASVDEGKANTTPSGPAWQRSPNDLYLDYYGVSGDAADEDNIGGFARYEHGIGNGWTLFGGISHSLRTADATERYLAANNVNPASRWIGNPDLAPEEHSQFELGATSGGESWMVTSSVFFDRVEDYILRDRARGQSDVLRSDGATIYRNVDARLFGGEVDAEIDWGGAWSSRAVISYVNAENTDDGQPIAQTPPLEGNLSLDWETDPWSAGVQLFWSVEQTRVDTDPTTGTGLDVQSTPGWATFDVYGKWLFGTDGEVSIGVRNILDRTYAYHVNRANVDPFNPDPEQVNEPGRTFWVRASISF